MKTTMKYGFSTLGDGNISYEGACRLATKYGLEFLELRVLEGNMDLPVYFREKKISKETIAKSVPVLGLCSSLKLTKAQPADVESFLAMAELADELKAPYIRVFGGNVDGWGEPLTTEVLDWGAKIAQQVQAELKKRNLRVEMLLETHDIASSSGNCLKLNSHFDTPLSILWDAHHTWKLGDEPLKETWAALGHLVRHVHYKDSVATAEKQPNTPGNYRFVLPGAGEFPTTGLFDLLKATGYSGGLSLEWERMWHPEIEPLEEAIAAYVRIVKANA